MLKLQLYRHFQTKQTVIIAYDMKKVRSIRFNWKTKASD